MVGLLCAILLVACSGPATDVTAVTSATDSATGQPADTPVSCAAVDAKAMLPGSAVKSASATPTPIPVDPEFAQVANLLATGVAAWDSGPLSLVGWGLGELLNAGQQGGDVSPQLQTALGNLSNQLNTIETQLNQIENQLAGVTGAIKDSTYQTVIQSLTTDHVTPIVSLWQNYCEITSTKDTDSTTIQELTSAILDSATGVSAHATAITQVFTGSAVTGEVALPGMFSTFLVDQGVPPMDDRPLYQQYIVPYAQYFANIVVMGMTLLVEANHQQGDNAQAQAAVDDLWQDVLAIYRTAGAPVSNDAGVLHIPSGNVWSRSPICVTATFDSTDADNHFNDPDIAQQAIADTASTLNDQTGAALARRVAAATATSASSPASTQPASPPTALSQLGDIPNSYNFSTGDHVCGNLWFLFAIPPGDWVPDALKSAGLPSANLYSGTGDANSVWRAPIGADYAALTGARGSASPQDYLNANGFAIPPADGLYAVPQLGLDYINNGQEGYFDATNGTVTCMFYAQCSQSAFLTFQVLATPECFLGSAEYKGLPTACGTDWLAAEWPSSPPPPATSTGTPTPPASATATPTSG